MMMMHSFFHEAASDETEFVSFLKYEGKGDFLKSRVCRLENHREKGKMRVMMFSNNEKDLKKSYSIKKNQKIKKQILTPWRPSRLTFRGKRRQEASS